MITLSRRHFLAPTATTSIGAALTAAFPYRMAAAAENEPTVLRAGSRTIEVNGKPAKVSGHSIATTSITWRAA